MTALLRAVLKTIARIEVAAFAGNYYFWLGLSVVAAVLFSLSGLVPALSFVYTIQDDARQHIFWLQFDGEILQGDLISDYFASVAPWGFKSLYHLVAFLGIDVFWFNKISPLLIGVATTGYCFALSYAWFPIAIAGFFSSVLLNQNLWLLDDLSSGTPRAFIYLLLLAFLYYLVKRNLAGCAIALIFQGLFYPQAVLISGALLGLRLVFCKSKKVEVWGLAVAVAIAIVYGVSSSQYAPVISLEMARSLPEFAAEGRSAFFSSNWVQFWLLGRRSGFFPIEWQYSLMLVYGLGLWWLKKYPRCFPLVNKLNSSIDILPQLLVASSCWFALAHLLLFRLHLPSRYTHHSIRLILALLAGITLTVVGERILFYLRRFVAGRLLSFIKVTLFILLLSGLLYPTVAVQSYPERLGYVTGEAAELYEFLQQQPPGSLVATLSEEGDFIPSLTGQQVLAAREYAIPYHWGYYKLLRQRIEDLITAQYSQGELEVRQFVQRYNPDFWLVDRNAFTTKYLQNNPWLQQFNSSAKAARNLEHQQPFILQNSDRCKLWEDSRHILIDAECLKD